MDHEQAAGTDTLAAATRPMIQLPTLSERMSHR